MPRVKGLISGVLKKLVLIVCASVLIAVEEQLFRGPSLPFLLTSQFLGFSLDNLWKMYLFFLSLSTSRLFPLL